MSVFDDCSMNKAFIQRQNVKIVHEPFDDAFFFGPERFIQGITIMKMLD